MKLRAIIESDYTGLPDEDVFGCKCGKAVPTPYLCDKCGDLYCEDCISWVRISKKKTAYLCPTCANPPGYTCNACKGKFHGDDIVVKYLPSFSFKNNPNFWYTPTLILCKECYASGELDSFIQEKGKLVSKLIKKWESGKFKSFSRLQNATGMGFGAGNSPSTSEFDIIYESSDWTKRGEAKSNN